MRNSFDARSVDYRHYRPDYPQDLCEYIVGRCGLQAGSRVLDVGAGTGKASAPWIARGMRTISVEQSLGMIRQGVEACPGARYLCSNAEQLGVRSAAFDLITSAQAFHCFDAGAALSEFARALKPSAFLAIFWYRLDFSFDHTRDVAELLGAFNTNRERLDEAHRDDWTARIEQSGGFEIIDRPQFSFRVPMTTEDWVGLARTVPYLRGSGEAFERSLRDRLSGYSAIDCPYVADFWLARKR